MEWMKYLCIHKWEKVSEVLPLSPFEVAMKAIDGDPNKVIPHQMCNNQRKHILVVACKECGKIKRFVTNID